MIYLGYGLRVASKTKLSAKQGRMEDINMEQEKIGGFIASLRKAGFPAQSDCGSGARGVSAAFAGILHRPESCLFY
jgi:hypothetical protein